MHKKSGASLQAKEEEKKIFLRLELYVEGRQEPAIEVQGVRREFQTKRSSKLACLGSHGPEKKVAKSREGLFKEGMERFGGGRAGFV